jgi:hypothetical protein
MAKSKQHSPKFSLVKSYYARKLWNEYRVRMAVVHAWITAEEFEEIVGKPYEEEEAGE